MNSNTFPMPAIDLSGKLIIKAQLGNDIRKIPIHNEEITYDELLLMMQRLFAGKIRSSDEITIKYKDEDGDLITLFDSSDLMFAKSLNRYLKLTLFVNGKPEPLEHDQIKEIKGELLDMRDKINSLISRLDTFTSQGSTPTLHNGGTDGGERTEDAPSVDAQQQQEQQQQQPQPIPSEVNRANAAMFDPLTNNEVVVVETSEHDPFAAIGAGLQQNPSPTPSNLSSQPSSLTTTYPLQQQQQQQPSQSQQQQQQSSMYSNSGPPPASQSYSAPSQEPATYPHTNPPPTSHSYLPQQQQQQSQQQLQQQQQPMPYQPQTQQPMPQPPSQAAAPPQPQQQSNMYPSSNQNYMPQPQQQNTQSSYASQGQQTSTYPVPGGDQTQGSGYPAMHGSSNPYSRAAPGQGRYPQPNQGYDYSAPPQPPQQQQQQQVGGGSVPPPGAGLGYPGPGYR